MSDQPKLEKAADVAASALMTNALQAINLGQIGADAITMSMDTNESANQLAQLLTEIGEASVKTREFSDIVKKTGEDIYKAISVNFQGGYNTIQNWNRLKGLSQKGNLGVSASIVGQRINVIAQKSHLNFWTKALFEMPESYAQLKLTKYYNKLYAPEEPNDRDMYMLWVNGLKTKAEYIAKFQEDLGWTQTDAQNIVDMRNWQYGVPSLKDAWTLVQRGIWLKEDWLKLATLGMGFTKADATAMYQLFSYVPSIGDVMSLSSLIPLDPIWVNAAFDRTGMSASDKQVFLDGINKSMILKEIRQMWSQIIGFYAYSGFTKQDLTNLLVLWKFPQAEIDIKIAIAELVKQKTVNQLMRDADIYLYRQATIDEITLYDRLIAMGLSDEMANAITRNEACKKGIDWELP